MTEHRCRWPFEPCDRCGTISEHQRHLPREEDERRGSPAYYRRHARWLALEALRGYASAPRTRAAAKVQRWLAELASEHGDGSFPELLARSGSKTPDFDAMEAWERKYGPAVTP